MDIEVGKFVLVNHAWLHVDEIAEDGTIWGSDSDGAEVEIALGDVELVE